MQHKRERITSSFVQLKMIAVLIFVAVPYINLVQEKNSIKESLVQVVIFWIFSALLWLFAITRKIIYYDTEKFYIEDWKGNQIDEVPNEKVSSMLFSGFGFSSMPSLGSYRLFYKNLNDEQKEFWIFPNLRTNAPSIMKKLKETNPNLLTSNLSFGGLEHLIFKNEDWFR